jgi:peptidoglycan/LPS O-acetylase OafA/YrhL
MQMKKQHTINAGSDDSADNYLVGLHSINACAAISGGLSLMSGAIKQAFLTIHTEFTNLYFPGLILFAIVGGSSLLALFATKYKMNGWQLSSTLAGIIMLFWIVGEIVSIRQFHWLQAVFLITSGLTIYFSLKAKEKPS